MYQQSVRKKNNVSEESRRKQCYESDFQEQARIILHRWILHCPKWVPPWNHAAALAPRFVFVLWKDVFSFRFVLCWPRLKRVRLKRDCNTIAFPRSSSLHTYTVSTRGSVQFHDWLAADTFLCEGGYVYKSLEGENSHSFFKWILSL